MIDTEKNWLEPRHSGKTFRFCIDDLKGYVCAGEFPDGSLGEIFLHSAKQGSILSGLMDALAISVSGFLQHASHPREALMWLTVKMAGLRFEPHGETGDPNLPVASSVIDYIFRNLALEYLTLPEIRRVEKALGFSLRDSKIIVAGEWTRAELDDGVLTK